MCGAPAQGITLTVANRSTTAQTVALKLTGADAASFRTLPEIALPAGSSTVAVSASTTITRLAIPAKSPLLTQAAQLEIDFKEAGITKVLPVQSVISAPVLASDVELIDFGIVGKTGVVTRGARISNSGMLGTVTISPTVVMGANGSKLTVSPTTFQIPRSGIVPITFTFTGGVASGGFPETTFTLSSPGQCSTPPAIKVVASTGT